MSIDYQKILLKATNTTITEYSVQMGTTEILPSAFINCTQLTNINMEESLFSNIGSNAFPTNCKVNNENTLLSTSCSKTSFSGRAIIPNDVTSIGDRAFSGCFNLTSVTIPEGVTSIGENVFKSCTDLKLITIPPSVTSIGDRAFYNCTGLTSVTIPEGVTSIGENVFFMCTSLTSVTIPEGVTSIGNYAFSYCSGLTSVTIPSSVTSIGDFAFIDCTNLTNIILENRTLEEAQSLIGTENRICYTGTITYDGGTYGTTNIYIIQPDPPKEG